MREAPNVDKAQDFEGFPRTKNGMTRASSQGRSSRVKDLEYVELCDRYGVEACSD